MGKKPWRTANGRIVVPGHATTLRHSSPFCPQANQVLPKTSSAERDRAVVQYWQQVDTQGVAIPPQPGVPVAGGPAVATLIFGVLRDQEGSTAAMLAAHPAVSAKQLTVAGASMRGPQGGGGGTRLKQDTKHWLMVHSVELAGGTEALEPPVPLFRGRTDRLLSGEGWAPAGLANTTTIPGKSTTWPAHGGQAASSQGTTSQQQSLWERRRNGQGGPAPSEVLPPAGGEAQGDGGPSSGNLAAAPRSPSPSRPGGPRLVSESPGSPRVDLGGPLSVRDMKLQQDPLEAPRPAPPPPRTHNHHFKKYKKLVQDVSAQAGSGFIPYNMKREALCGSQSAIQPPSSLGRGPTERNTNMSTAEPGHVHTSNQPAVPGKIKHAVHHSVGLVPSIQAVVPAAEKAGQDQIQLFPHPHGMSRGGWARTFGKQYVRPSY